MNLVNKIKLNTPINLVDSSSESDIDQCQSPSTAARFTPNVSFDKMKQLGNMTLPNIKKIQSQNVQSNLVIDGRQQSIHPQDYYRHRKYNNLRRTDRYQKNYSESNYYYGQHDKQSQNDSRYCQNSYSKNNDYYNEQSQMIDQSQQPEVRYQNNLNQVKNISEIQNQQMIQLSRSIEQQNQDKNEKPLRRLKKFSLLYAKQSKAVKIQQKEKKVDQTICSICIGDLTSKKQDQLGRLKCKHVFCIDCITEASNFSNKCPYCRAKFNQIQNGKATVLVQDKELEQEQQQQIDYGQPCYVCGRDVDYDILLVCDSCDRRCCHTYCDRRLTNLQQNQIPDQNWFCEPCAERMQNQRRRMGRA